MAILPRSLDDMIRDVLASLKAGKRGDQGGSPAFTLVLGSGFSVPIIPTPTRMLNGDIAWWRYCNDQRIEGDFCHRDESIKKGLAKQEDVAAFERELWKEIHTASSTSDTTAFPLTAEGLPDLSSPTAIGRAYQAVMARGLVNNKMRRQYLRAAIKRTYPKVNAAHIFLAGILEAQESWNWGAPFCRTIFTTNFDPLLQRSLQLVNKLYFMSDRPDVLEAPDDDQSDAIHLVYTHGSVHRYDLLNTEAQIASAKERNASNLVGYFKHHGVIVIGYSGWADTTMQALLSCASFDSNLYWCDVHSAGDTEARLRPDVLKILETAEKNAFYVPIAGADEAMRLLHRALNLGDVPKFILDPVGAMITQLNSIDVPTTPAVPGKSDTGSISTSLAELLDATLVRLNVAKSAFDNPSVGASEADVAKALIAKLLSEAFIAYSEGNRDQAIKLLNMVIETPSVPSIDLGNALQNRGVTLAENGETTKAIKDFSAVIDMPDAPAKQKAKALYNRGVSWGESGDSPKAIADYSAVIDIPDAPADQKAMALYNRGVRWGESGDTAKEIADYSAVIDMPDAPAEPKAKALNNRGVRWGQGGDTAKEIADYSAVIDMPDASAEPKAKALYNRSVRWKQSGQTAKEIADYTAVIDMPDAPVEQKVKALNNRAYRWGESGEMAKAIADYSAVVDMPDAPAELKARAFLNRGWCRYAAYDDVKSMIDDSKKAVVLAGANLTARSNLALGLLLAGDTEAARTEYETVATQATNALPLQSAIDDLEKASNKTPDLPGARENLERLRGAIQRLSSA